MNPRIASLIATAVLVAAVLALLLRHALLATGAPFLGAQALAVLLMAWARVTFGLRSFHAGANPTAGGIVSRGPYAWIRHPIYAAILLFVWAGMASHGGAVDAVLAGIATLGVAVRIGAEERLLRETYPDYVDYARRTKRLIPFVF